MLERPWTWVRTHPSAMLLYAQLLGIVLYPFLEGPGDARHPL